MNDLLPNATNRDWVNCPICGEPDMRREEDGDGNVLIHCVNHACASNGGDNYGALVPFSFSASAQVAIDGYADLNRQLLAKSLEADKLRQGLATLTGAIKRSDELYQEWETQRNAIDYLTAKLAWLRDHCSIVFHPPDGRYPLQHNPHARKDMWDQIIAEMTRGTPPPLQKWRCRRCDTIVDMKAFRCNCVESPSPWEPVPHGGQS